MPSGFRCIDSCRRKFDTDTGLDRHQKFCAAYKNERARRKRARQLAESDPEMMERERQLVEEEKRRRREQEAVVDRLIVRCRSSCFVIQTKLDAYFATAHEENGYIDISVGLPCVHDTRSQGGGGHTSRFSFCDSSARATSVFQPTKRPQWNGFQSPFSSSHC